MVKNKIKRWNDLQYGRRAPSLLEATDEALCALLQQETLQKGFLQRERRIKLVDKYKQRVERGQEEPWG
jgi:hypothetical protein